MLVFLLIALLSTTKVHAESIINANNDFHSQWKRLLHHSNGENEVVSGDFFLSEGRSPESELSVILKELTAEDGMNVACEFPARYELVKQHFSVPNFDLTQCRSLAKFIDSFQNGQISIVLASELRSSPTSAFGHLMLVFHSGMATIDLADAIHFAATTDPSESFLTYAGKGLTGRHSGFFFREPFFLKRSEYLQHEQRYLYFYELDFSLQQRELIIHHLFELRRAEFRYFFVKKNCAYQIASLLSIATHSENFPDSIFVLPIAVLEKYKSHLKLSSTLAPSLALAKRAISEFSTGEADQFSNLRNGSIDLNATKDKLSEGVRSALFYYYEYSFRKHQVVLPDYKTVSALTFRRGAETIHIDDPLLQHKPTLAFVGIENSSVGLTAKAGIRPVLNGLTDLQLNDQQESEMIILGTTLAYNRDTIRLEDLKIVSAKLMNFQTQFFGHISWGLYSGLNRENSDLAVQFENEFSLGIAYGTNSRFKTALMLGLGNVTVPSTLSVFLKPSLEVMYYLDRAIKLSASGYYRRLLHSGYLQIETALTYEVGNWALFGTGTIDLSTNNFKSQMAIGSYF